MGFYPEPRIKNAKERVHTGALSPSALHCTAPPNTGLHKRDDELRPYQAGKTITSQPHACFPPNLFGKGEKRKKKAMASLEGKVYAFTGGASGIGLAAAKIVSRRGATVCIADVDPEAMRTAEEYFTQQQQQKEGGGSVRFSITKVDVSRREEVDAFVEGVVAQFGRLDGACNSAGIIGRVHGLRDVADLEDEEWHKIIAVNLTGTMYCLRAQLRKVVDGGSIVNVSSIHGLHGKKIKNPPSAVFFSVLCLFWKFPLNLVRGPACIGVVY